MKKRKEKRGERRGEKNSKAISPLVATILLVGIAIVAFVLIFTWMKEIAKEQIEKFGEPIEDWCEKVEFDASITADEKTVFIDNIGDVPLYAFNLEIEKTLRTKVEFVRPTNGIISPGESDFLVIDLSGEKKIKAVPILLGEGRDTGEGKLFVCEGSAKTLR